jgi:hypothetical protein
MTTTTTSTTTTTTNKLFDLQEFVETTSLSPYELAICRRSYFETREDEKEEETETTTTTDLSKKNDLAQELVTILQEELETSIDNERLLWILKALRNVSTADPTLMEEVIRHSNTQHCLEMLCRCNEHREEESGLLHSLVESTKKMLARETTVEDEDEQKSYDSSNDDADGQEQYSRLQLQSRLPLLFTLPPTVELMLHQYSGVESGSTMHDTGFVMWPAAIMLSDYISKNPTLVENATSILELGAGCGLAGLTAAAMIKKKRCDGHTINTSPQDVLFTDYNRTVLENLERNILLNNLQHVSSVCGMDFFDQEGDQVDRETSWIDMDGTSRKQVSLVLAVRRYTSS